jgi:hypothetical protein
VEKSAIFNCGVGADAFSSPLSITFLNYFELSLIVADIKEKKAIWTARNVKTPPILFQVSLSLSLLPPFYLLSLIGGS